jgi:hypothetical protein
MYKCLGGGRARISHFKPNGPRAASKRAMSLGESLVHFEASKMIISVRLNY